VKGVEGALKALVTFIASKTHLIHYGSEFLPFLDLASSYSDQDAAWALKEDDASDDGYSFIEVGLSEANFDSTSDDPPQFDPVSPPTTSSRERKSSLPLPKLLYPGPGLNINQTDSVDPSPKQQIKDLVKLAQDVMNSDADEIAQEITRQGVKRFLEIKVCPGRTYTDHCWLIFMPSHVIGSTILFSWVEKLILNPLRLLMSSLII